MMHTVAGAFVLLAWWPCRCPARLGQYVNADNMRFSGIRLQGADQSVAAAWFNALYEDFR